eukprot:2223823-Amphidinium_carterae.1
MSMSELRRCVQCQRVFAFQVSACWVEHARARDWDNLGAASMCSMDWCLIDVVRLRRSCGQLRNFAGRVRV